MKILFAGTLRIRVSIIGQPMSCTWLTESVSIVENDIIDNLWRTPNARNRWAGAYQLCRILFPSYSPMPYRELSLSNQWVARGTGFTSRGLGREGDKRKRDEEKEEKDAFVRRALFLREWEKDGTSCRAPPCVGRVSAKRAHAAAQLAKREMTNSLAAIR